MVFKDRWSDYAGPFLLKSKSSGLKFGGLIGQVDFIARWSLSQVSLYVEAISVSGFQ